jgi:hypothetical protein
LSSPWPGDRADGDGETDAARGRRCPERLNGALFPGVFANSCEQLKTAEVGYER